MDELGNPIYVQPSSGDIHDSIIAEDVLNQIELKPNETTVLAKKSYGSYSLREYIANWDTDFCIPPKSNSIDPWYCDWSLYKERRLVECFFNKLKENRRIATRFDNLHLASSLSSILVVVESSLHDYADESNLETHPGVYTKVQTKSDVWENDGGYPEDTMDVM